MYRWILHAGGQGKGIVFIAAAQVTVETPFTDPAQTAEPCLSFFVKAHENDIAVALVPAFIKPSSLDAVVDHPWVDSSFFEVVHHSPVIGRGLREKQMLWLFLFRSRHKRRRLDCRPSGDGFHRVHKRIAIDLNEIVQGAVSADSTGEPAPLAVGNPQAVMGLGAVDIAGHMDKFLGFTGLQIGE